ncbi:flagellar hook-associated protein FlgK [Sinisalibacter aestuarii]|uniref:Flagellar hook-associated protein 1 n=1 Tax=Sinisalibacter aestuarii TaxID=2949426 RepID=A0ABQ5LPJ3_9RHOB|nr:flagellar hook-associated protein FlgK [Sinisalibacter aestuarii]GKY86668.1 flagellar hook-associated protein [Sinisalibacter aestuarii]
MTIAGSLSNALSGLAAQARAAELVSSNVANANTRGYARRELELTSTYMGGSASAGVSVAGVRREVDISVVQDRRLADAALGHDSTIAGFHAELEAMIGSPGEAGSLSGRIATFEAALIDAGARPDSEARLAAVLEAATALAGKIATASDKVQAMRMEADAAIDGQVRQLNDGLTQVQTLNYEIREAVARGHDPSALQDLRQQTIDAISAIVPMRQVDRDHGMVALYTTGGAIVLDGRAADIGFARAGVIVPEMTQAGGALSGLTINGMAIRSAGDRSPIQGGSLSALFGVRDELAVSAQARLDAVARDLVERFQDGGLDATRGAGDAGLFTDAGAAFAAADEAGLSARLSVNAAVDPARGGALWRLRDGLGAAAPGDVGDARLLQALSGALTAERVPASGGFLGAARSASGLAAELLSVTGAARLAAEARQSQSAAQQDSLTVMELEGGVDTDHELQKLMLIEQAYAANAKVLATVGDMIDTLMGL